MKIVFETPQEFEALRLAAHDGILYWTKKRQHAQGKINMSVDGSGFPYDEESCVDMMIAHAQVLATIERSPHPEWNDETQSYEMVTDANHVSAMIEKIQKLMPQAEDIG